MAAIEKRGAGRLALIALSFVACAPPLDLELILPAVLDAHSALLAVERQDGPTARTLIDLEAIDLDDSSQHRRRVLDRWDGTPPLVVGAMIYKRPLSALGIPAGPFKSSGDGPVPPADQVFERNIENRQRLGDWIDRGSVTPGGFASVHLPQPATPCAEFKATRVDWPGNLTAVTAALVQLDGSQVLVVPENGPAALVSSGGMIQEVERTSTVSYYGGIKLADGSLILSGAMSTLWSAQLTGARLEVDPAPLPGTRTASEADFDQIHWLAAGTSPDNALEIFALSYHGRFMRYTHDSWELLHQFPSFSGSNARGGALFRTRPGEAEAIKPEQLALVRWSQGTITEDPLPEHYAPFSMAMHPTLGPLIGTSIGQILSHDPAGDWVPISNSATGYSLQVVGLLPYGDGFIYAGYNGFIGQFLHGQFCAARQIAYSEENQMADFADGSILAAGAPSALGAPDYPTLLTP